MTASELELFWCHGLRCQTRVLKHLSSQACVGIILRTPPISCRQGRYTRETDCGLDSRTSIMYRCEHKTCANTLILENQDINSRSNTSLSSTGWLLSWWDKLLS